MNKKEQIKIESNLIENLPIHFSRKPNKWKEKEIVKLKKIESSQQKYGTDNPSQANEVKEKRVKTFQDVYGENVNCPSKISDFREKFIKTSQEKYGCDPRRCQSRGTRAPDGPARR